MTNTFPNSFLRALFPQQRFFGSDEAGAQKSSAAGAHRNKRVKYVHEPTPEVDCYLEEEEDDEFAELGREEDEHQLRLEHKSCAKALLRRKMAERISIDPDGDLLLILNEKMKVPKKHSSTAIVPIPIDDSAIVIEPGADGEATVAEGQQEEEDHTNADVEKEKRQTELKEIHMLVSSKHMVLVSPVFKAMLQWSNFKESHAHKPHAKVEVPLPDDDPEAMRILVDIVHCHHKDVPRKVKVSLLTHLAILVDKYRLHEAVQIYSDMWISHAKKKFPSSMAEDGVEVCLQWLCISWVFEKSRDFTTVTRIFQQESTQGLSKMIEDSDWDIPVPSTVIGKSN